MSDDGLEAALDGLVAASNYCHEIGESELSAEVAGLYQLVADESPEEHWDEVDDDFAEYLRQK